MSPFEEDPFHDSRMSLGDHLEELRARLWFALLGFAVALVLGFFVSRPALEFIAAPLDRELAAFHQQRLKGYAERLAAGDPRLSAADRPVEVAFEVRRADLPGGDGGRPETADEWLPLRVRIRPLSWVLSLAPVQQTVRRPVTGLTPTEPFTVYFKVSLYCGVVLASPWIFYQLWAFVAAGLYPHEKRQVRLYLPLSIALFLGGVALCEFVVLPMGLSYLLSYYELGIVLCRLAPRPDTDVNPDGAAEVF